MQQTPQSTPSVAPAPAAAGTPSATIGGTQVPLEGLPRNAQEVEGLRARREILRDQLERATNRREELAGQLGGEGERVLTPEARAGVQQRLNLLDERILQIERDQTTTERLLSNAPPAVLAQTVEQPRNQGPMISEDDAAGMAFGTFSLGVALTLFAGWMRRRFRRRRAGAARGETSPAYAALTTDPRIERLTQAVDAIAEEVERIGEGQRFVTNLLAGRQPEAVPVPIREAERR